jgi:hypothetical protein
VSGLHQHQELVLQVGAVSSDLGRVELLVPAVKAVFDLLRDVFVCQDTLAGGLGRVVALGDLRAVAVFLDPFLLGAQEVRG